jgi:hypothetical protein
MVAEIIAFWSEIELHRGRYLGALLGDNLDAGIAMYLAITSAATRRSVLDAASKTRLNEPEYDLFCRAMKTARVVENERNDFAHGMWGYSDDISDGLLLVDYDARLEDMLKVDRLYEQMRSGVIRWPSADIRLDHSKIKVHRQADLRRSRDRASGVHRLMYYLAGLPALPQGTERDQLRLRLSGELPHPRPWPRIRTDQKKGYDGMVLVRV